MAASVKASSPARMGCAASERPARTARPPAHLSHRGASHDHLPNTKTRICRKRSRPGTRIHQIRHRRPGFGVYRATAAAALHLGMAKYFGMAVLRTVVAAGVIAGAPAAAWAQRVDKIPDGDTL